MKFKLLFINIALLYFLPVSGQKGINFQFLFNPGITSLSGDWKVPKEVVVGNFNKVPKKITIGFEGGLKGGFNFNERIGLNIGILYLLHRQSFGIYTDIARNINYERKINLSFFKIPVNFTYNSNPENNISFIFSAGLYYSIIFSYRDKEIESFTNDPSSFESYEIKGKNSTYTSQSGSNIVTYKNDLDNNIYRNDIGVNANLGLQKKINPKLFLLLSLNFEKGFLDIRNFSSKWSNGSSSYYQDFDINYETERKTLMLGIILGLKKYL